MPFLLSAVSFLMGPIMRWVVMGAGALIFTAWMRHNAAAPYADRVEELRTAIVKQHQSAERDRVLAEANAARAEELENELEKIKSPTGTRLTGDELGRLRKLAGARSGSR